MRLTQLNVNHASAAQYLLGQLAEERGSDILLVSEPYWTALGSGWHTSLDTKCAIKAVRPDSLSLRPLGRGEWFVAVEAAGVAIISGYISPNIPLRDFETCLDELTTLIVGWPNVILGGDLNAHHISWGSENSCPRGRVLLEWATSVGLFVANRGAAATFSRAGWTSVIDITLASRSMIDRIVGWTVLDHESLSDHKYIEFDVLMRPGAVVDQGAMRNEPRWIRSTWDPDSCAVMTDWAVSEIEARAGETSASEMAAEAIAVEEMSCAAAMARGTSGPPGRKAAFWWNEELAELRRACNTARRKVTRLRARHRLGPSAELELALGVYRDAKASFSGRIKARKRECWAELLETLEGDPWGLPYKIVRNALRRRKPPEPREHVQAAVRILFPERPVPQGPIRGDPDCPEVTVNEILKAAGKIKTRKAPGPNGLPPEVTRAVLESRPDFFAGVFTALLREGLFPVPWKRQRLALVPKPGRSGTDVGDLRPICLVDTLGKAFESVITARLTGFVEGARVLSDSQYGFRQGRSTIQAIEEVVHFLKPAIRGGHRTRSKFAVLVAIDIKNAFNSVGWAEILSAVEEIPGIPEHLTSIIRCYFRDRIMVADTDEGVLEWSVSGGVPQGSVLGPLLWNLFFDGLLRLDLGEGVRAVCFADDTAILAEARSKDRLVEATNEALSRVRLWLTGRGLAIAAAKTKAIVVGKGAISCGVWSFRCGEDEIVAGKSLRYLGVEVDNYLIFREHIRGAGERGCEVATSLSRLLPNMRGPHEAIRRIYLSVIVSVVLYGVEIWIDAAKRPSWRVKAERSLRLATLRITRAVRTVSSEAVHVLAGVPPFHLLADERVRISRRVREAGVAADRESIGRDERTRTIVAWQELWVSSSKGAWTRELIPSIESWVGRKHGLLTYHLTQMLTGHGSFGFHRNRFGRDLTGECICGGGVDTAKHTLVECARWEPQRDRVRAALGGGLGGVWDGARVVTHMLRDPRAWDALSGFATEVILAKDADEGWVRPRRGGRP